MSKLPVFRCACQFAKTLNEKDGTQFPRVGLVDSVLYRGAFIVEHRPTETCAIISRKTDAGGIPPEADACCFDWFDPASPRQPHDFSAIPNGTTFTARFCDDSGEHRFERDKDGVFWFAGETERVDGPDWFGHAGYCEWRNDAG